MESGKGREYQRRPVEGGQSRPRPPEDRAYRNRKPEDTERRQRSQESPGRRQRPGEDEESRRRPAEGGGRRQRPAEDSPYEKNVGESTERRSGRRRTRPRRRGNIKRIRQRNRRVVLLLLVLLVGGACAVNTIRTKQKEAAAQAAQAYAEQQARKESQEAAKEKEKEEEENALKLADESEKDQWYLKLVNAKNPMTKEDVPEVAAETIDANGYQVDARIMKDLEEMFAAAREAGRNPVICSAFRAWDTQEYLYQNKIQRVMAEKGLTEEEAAVEAGTVVAVPGTSEHQIGLALDIVSSEYMNLDEKQMETEDQQWLMENSWKYGFILRYPLNKSNITGIIFEPWHYRYVGKEAAKEIYEQDITLEEYLGAEPVGEDSAIESDREEKTTEPETT